MVKNIFNVFIAALLVMSAVCAQAAKISVTTDRTELQDNESFTLEYSSDSSVDDEPDFSPIEKNFNIISRSQSSNIQFINGRLDRQSTWVLVLMPKAVGEFTIPAIRFGTDKSDSITVKVTRATASKSNNQDMVYIEAFADTKSALVQSQIIYTLRIYHAVRFRNASLSELEVSDKDANIEKLEENKKYSKFINGRRYEVFEKRYAIFPQNVGRLTIEPAVLEVQYIEAMRTIRSKRLVSDKITIDVKPIPEIARQKNLSYWLPASDVKLEEKWSDQTDNLQIGEPLTRTITLTASGLLSSALPDLSGKFPVKGLKHYPDQPALDNRVTESGFIGKRQEKIAYIPSQSGKVTLPSIDIYWWDTQKNQLRKASLPSKEIVIAGGSNQLSDNAANEQQPPAKAETEAEPGDNTAGGKGTNASDRNTVNVGGLSYSIWFWISMLLLLLWIATLVLWLTTRKGTSQTVSYEPSDNRKSRFSNDAIRKIKVACSGNNPQNVKEALLEWAGSLWPDRPPSSLGHIAQRVGGKLSREIDKLNDALYKPGGSSWDGNALLTSLQKYIDEQREQEKQPSSKIKPLFRIASNQ